MSSISRIMRVNIAQSTCYLSSISRLYVECKSTLLYNVDYVCRLNVECKSTVCRVISRLYVECKYFCRQYLVMSSVMSTVD